MRAVKNGSSQTITNNTDTVVTLIDDFDLQGWFTSNQFKPTIAGYYNITAQVWWDAGSVTNNQTNIQFKKNGSTQLVIDQTQIVTGSGYGQSIDTIAYFNGTTDYVELTAYTGNTTSQNINGAAGGTFFTAALYAYGAQGASGSTGLTGATGTQGASGLNGSTGPTGASGVNGSTGPTGSTGVNGASGAQGASGVYTINTVLVTTSTYTVASNDYYIGINRAGTVTITLTTPSNGTRLIIKDESGNCSIYPITVLGTVDNDADGFILQTDNGAIELIYRSGWRII